MNWILKPKSIILIFCIITTVLLVYLPQQSVRETKNNRKTHHQTSRNKKLLRILYWNDYYGSRGFGFCCGRGPYIKNKCKNSQCFTSKDRSEDVETFDAIVFHGRDLNITDIPQKRLNFNSEIIYHCTYTDLCLCLGYHINFTYFLLWSQQHILALKTLHSGTTSST